MEEPKTDDIQIRAASPEDAGALLEIYAPYVENTAITFEYDVPSVNEFAERIQKTLKRYPYLAAEKNGRIVGYGYASAFHERAAYDWAAEMSVYVSRDARGGGVGSALYQRLEQILREMNIVNPEACIAYAKTEDKTLTNDSMRFHEALGYRLVGRFSRCGYKFGRWYDMIWMEKIIGIHFSPMPAVINFPEISPCILP